MSLDILNKQKDDLIRRAIVRSYMKSSIAFCPTCKKTKSEKSLQEIKETMLKINNQFHPTKS